MLRKVNFQIFLFETSVLTSYSQEQKAIRSFSRWQTELTVPFRYFALDTKHQKTEHRLKEKCSKKTF